MTKKLTSLRTLLAALLVAGGVGVACSSHQRSHEPTTVAEAPLGKSTKDYPLNPNLAPPDAAEAPEQYVGPAHPLSSGAVHGATTAPVANNPNGVNGPGANEPTNTGGTPGSVPVPVPVNTPTNPSTPAPTPASPNAPTTTPAPNPMPPSGGAPVQGAPNTGTTGTGPTGTGPAPQPTQPRSTPPSTVREARGTFQEPLDPYQLRSDGGIAPPRPMDGGVTAPRDAAPVTPRDSGVGPGGRSDAGILGIRNDGGIGR